MNKELKLKSYLNRIIETFQEDLLTTDKEHRYIVGLLEGNISAYKDVLKFLEED